MSNNNNNINNTRLNAVTNEEHGALRRINNYEGVNITTFRNLDDSGRIKGFISLSDAFDYIKNNPQKENILKARELGKTNDEVFSIDKIYSYDKKEMVDKPRNMYEHIKQVRTLVVNWSAHFKQRRKKSHVESVQPFMYLDIDDFSKVIEMHDEITSLDDAMNFVFETVTSNDFIVAGWKSFGGNGFGFLAFVPNLSTENIKSTFNTLSEYYTQMGIQLDSAVKDITRCNVLSYDPNMFIREPTEVRPFVAVESNNKVEKTFEKTKLPSDLVSDVLSQLMDNLYNNKDNWNIQENRLAYKFYQLFFSITNQYGIEMNDSFDYLLKNITYYPKLFSYRTQDDVYNIGSHQYDTYASQFSQAVYYGETDNKMYEKNVKEIYVLYSGDVQIQLAYFWNIVKNQKNPLFSLAVTAKKAGILKHSVSLFLQKSKNFDSKTNETLSWIYGNTLYAYGLDYEYTDEAKKLQFEAYLKKVNESGYELIKAEDYYDDLKEEMVRYLDDYASKGLNNKINAMSFFTPIFKKAKSLNIHKSVLRELIDDQLKSSWGSDIHIEYFIPYISSFTFDDFFDVMYKSIVDYRNHLNGFVKNRKITKDELKKRYEFSEEYTLSKGSYINELSISTDKSKRIWGDTGQGKTTWICNNIDEPRVILVPVQLLLEGIDVKYSASVYFQLKKNVREGDRLIISTYSSAPALFDLMRTWDFGMENYKLFFDEHHNFAASASSNYRGTELNEILDNASHFKSFITMTGTKFPIFHPVLDKMDIVRVKWEKTPKKHVTPVVYKDKYFALSSRLSKEKKNLIYLQSKNEHGDLGKLVEYLKLDGHKNISFINSNSKNSEDFLNIVNQEFMKEGTQTLITTSVMVEGVTLLDADVASVHFLTHENDLLMEQFMNRLRTVFIKNNGKGCMGYIYISKKKYNSRVRGDYDVVEQQKKYIDIAEKHLDYLSHIEDTSNLYTKAVSKNLRIQMLDDSFMFRRVNGRYTIDYLGIANKCFTEEKYASYGNIEFLKTKLSEYNWVFHEVEFDNGKFKEQAKEMVGHKQDGKRIDYLDNLDKLREEIEAMDYGLIDRILEDAELQKQYEYRDDFEDFIDMLSKFRYLYKHFEETSVYEIMEDFAGEDYSKGVWERYSRQIRTKASTVGLRKHISNYSDAFKEEILRYYDRKVKNERKTGSKTFSSINQLINIVENRKRYDSRLKNTPITEKVALTVLSHFFTIEKQLFNDVMKYNINGLNVKNDIEIMNGKLNDWAKEHYEKGTKMSTKRMASELNMIRREMPFLKKFKFTTRNVMKFLNNYFTVERKSRILSEDENGRKKYKNTYEIVSLNSELFEKYKLKSEFYHLKTKTVKKDLENA